jgi:hypothetical protein
MMPTITSAATASGRRRFGLSPTAAWFAAGIEVNGISAAGIAA